MTSGADLPPKIGRYVVEAELGRGAMGVVYRGRDPRIDRPVALKTLLPQPGLDEESVRHLKERFLNEGRAAGRLSHPGIVAVHDAGEDPATGMAYLAMELVDGEDLRAVMARGVPPQRLVEILAQVASALDHAHSRGVIHRDLKPANVFVDGDGRAKLGDFGIARLGDSTLTQTGQFIGSPAYMSPEQVRARPVGPSSDVFSLGVVLYEGLTGKRPFGGDSLVSTTHAIANAPAARPSELKPGLAPALDAVLERALAKDPAARWPTATALTEAAAAALTATDVEATRLTPRPAARDRGRRTLPWIGLAVLAVVGFSVGAWVLFGRDEPAAERVPVEGAEPAPAPPEAEAPRESPRAAAPRSASVLRVDLHTFASGVLVVEADGQVVGRIAAQGRTVGRMKKLKNPKFEFSRDFEVPSGRVTFAFRFAKDKGDALSHRSVRESSPGGRLSVVVDVGTLGRDLDVRWQ